MNPVLIQIFFNLMLVFVGAIILLEIYNRLFIPSKFMAYKFEYFKLRDRLGHLAIEGRISQNSEEYHFLISVINSYIKYTSEVGFVEFFRQYLRLERNPEYNKELEQLISRSCNLCPETSALMKDLCALTLKIIFDNSYIIKIFVSYSSFRERMLKINHILGDVLVNKAKAALDTVIIQKERLEQLERITV